MIFIYMTNVMAYFKCKCDITRDSGPLHSLSLALSLSFTHSVMPFKLNRIWFTNSHIIVPSKRQVTISWSLPHILTVILFEIFKQLIISISHIYYIQIIIKINRAHIIIVLLLNSVLHHATSLSSILTLFIRNPQH